MKIHHPPGVPGLRRRGIRLRKAYGGTSREYPTSTRNVAGIPLPGVPVSIIPATPLGVIQRALRQSSGQARGGVTSRADCSPRPRALPPQRIPSRNRGVYFGHVYPRGRNKRHILFDFSVSPCLKPYSAGGESEFPNSPPQLASPTPARSPQLN